MQFDLSAFKTFQIGQHQPATKPAGKSLICRNRRTGGFVFVSLNSEQAPEFGDLVAVQGNRNILRVEIYDGQPFVGVVVPATEPAMLNEFSADEGSEDSFPQWL